MVFLFYTKKFCVLCAKQQPDRPDGKKIPIIAMTANAFAEDIRAALDAGMDGHVAKPVDMGVLLSVITKHVKR